MSTSTTDRLGRPKKSPLERRTLQRKVRFNPIEDGIVEAKSRQAGLDFTTYVREAALGHDITASFRRSADPELVTKLNQLGEQTRALGNVVNQVARALHTDRMPPSDWEALPEMIAHLHGDISATLDQVILDDDA